MSSAAEARNGLSIHCADATEPSVSAAVAMSVLHTRYDLLQQ